jgi:tetratricopeptide (TPR) repeat protein
MKKNQKGILFFILFSPGIAVSQQWKVISDSARLSLDRKDNGKAIEYYTKANEILKNDSALSITYAESNSLLGDLFLNTGQYPKAEPYFIIAKDLREKLQGKENACETGLGDINGNEGVYGLQRALKMAGV